MFLHDSFYSEIYTLVWLMEMELPRKISSLLNVHIIGALSISETGFLSTKIVKGHYRIMCSSQCKDRQELL